MPNVLFSFLLLVLHLAINTAGQIKHLQTFQKLVLLPLLRSGRSKDLSKICYAETCVWLFFVYEKVHLRWYKFFLTVPSGKGQKEFSFQGSSSYLPDNYLRTRKVISWSCLFLFTESACSQNIYFKCMCHFWKEDKKREEEPLQEFFSSASNMKGKWKQKTLLRFRACKLETYILSVSNGIKKFLLQHQF